MNKNRPHSLPGWPSADTECCEHYLRDSILDNTVQMVGIIYTCVTVLQLKTRIESRGLQVQVRSGGQAGGQNDNLVGVWG